MTIEDELKEYILTRYKSLKEFSEYVDIPNSTINTILKRGISNANVGNIIKICKTLNISADSLSDGKIEPKLDYVKPSLDVRDIVDDTKTKLSHALTIDGENIDNKSIESLTQALEIGYEMTKRNSTRE